MAAALVPADFCPIPRNTGPTLPDIPIFFREARNLILIGNLPIFKCWLSTFHWENHPFLSSPGCNLSHRPNSGVRQAGSRTGMTGLRIGTMVVFSTWPYHQPHTAPAQGGRINRINTWTHKSLRKSCSNTWPSQQAKRRALGAKPTENMRLGDSLTTPFPSTSNPSPAGAQVALKQPKADAALLPPKDCFPPRGQATHRLSTACMEMKRAGTLKVSKKTSAARSLFFRGFKGASVRSTGCWWKMHRWRSGRG